MPVKAGKFTLIPNTGVPVAGAAGTNVGFEVSGIGFEPDTYIVITAGVTAEDSWDTTPFLHGGVAISGKAQYPALNVCTGLTEHWGTDIRPTSFWSDTGVIWLRTSHGSSGPAFYVGNTTPDGFRIGYPGGFEGGYGVVCYYLAIQSEANAARVLSSSVSSMPVTLGWEPSLILSLGSGGTSPGTGAIAFVDMSVPSWGFGGFENIANPTDPGPQWLANGLAHATSVEQQRFFDDGSGQQVVYTSPIVAQTIANAFYTWGRTPTTVSVTHFDGFPQGPNARIAAHLMEGAVYSGGQVTPNAVGVPLAIDTGFSPEAVIFLGPQDHHVANIGVVPWGGRSFGFLTDDFECCVAWGGYQQIGSAAAFSTSNFSWLSNFTSTQLNAVTTPNYGTAEIGGNGFTMHTQALPKFNKYMRYAAFGFEEAVPGFFRVI